MNPRALLDAAGAGDVAQARAALAAGAPLDTAPATDSALCLAAMYGHLAVARVLLEAGADVNHRGSYGRTPLHYAAQKSLELTSLLIERGADLRARNEGDEDVLIDLVTQDGADAVIAQRLIDAGLDLSYRPTKYYPGRSHLMWACFCGRLPIIEVLLAAGVDPSEQQPNGGNALSHAMSGMKQGIVGKLVQLLVRAGVDPNLKAGIHHVSLLMVACRKGDLETARLLLERGADPNARDNGTPLTHAAKHPKLRAILLEYGAKPAGPPPQPEETLALRRAALASPGDGAARLAWGRALVSQGFRAAAHHEFLAARALGLEVRDTVDFEHPEGTPWRFTDFVPASGDVAPMLDDSRFPGARVTSGARTLPLSIVLGPFCTNCDAHGQAVCHACDGTGTRPGFTNPDAEYPCDPTETCAHCGGTKYVLNTGRFGEGACEHGALVEELSGPGFTLLRCPKCGLPAVTCGSMFVEALACGECGRLACTCR